MNSTSGNDKKQISQIHTLLESRKLVCKLKLLYNDIFARIWHSLLGGPPFKVTLVKYQLELAQMVLTAAGYDILLDRKRVAPRRQPEPHMIIDDQFNDRKHVILTHAYISFGIRSIKLGDIDT